MTRQWMVTLAATLLSAMSCGDDETSDTDAKSDAGATTEKPDKTSKQTDGLDAIPSEMRPEKIVDDLKKQLLAPNLSNHGVALFTDVMTLPAGADVSYCTYTKSITKERMYMHSTQGVQSKYGHHVLLQYVPMPIDPVTHECPPSSLEAQQGGTIIGGNGKEGFADLPDNVVSEVPAGAQFMITHHWINVSDKPVDVQAEVVTVPVDPSIDEKDLIVARSLVLNSTDFMIAPHSSGKGGVECEFDRTVKLISALGHEHEWGTNVNADRSGSVDETIFDYPFEVDYVTHPKVNYYSVDDPYVINAGDKIKFTCQWNNTEDTPLTFPSEMCAFQAWQIGAERDGICNSGAWISR